MHTAMPESPPKTGERRQTPRFACGGRVRIASLPLEGDALRGRLLDLSLGGCCVESVQPLEPGTRTEVLLQVNDASFRALTQVVATRGHLAGLQFVRLTDAGNRMLRDLVAEVAKFHAAVSALRGARRLQDPELFLDEEQVPDLKRQFPILSRFVTVQPEEKDRLVLPDREPSRLITPSKKICVVSIDLFV